MQKPASYKPEPLRSASVPLAHHASSYSFCCNSVSPLSDHLTFIWNLLNESAASQELDSDIFPTSTDRELRSLSTSKTILIQLFGIILATLVSAMTKIDKSLQWLRH